MYKFKCICLVFWIAVVATNLCAQDITSQGAGSLKLGMSAQQFKSAFPGAQTKKEIQEGDEALVGIIARAEGGGPGLPAAKATFYQSKIVQISLFDARYKLNGVPVGSTFKDLKDKIKIRSIYYAPDGEEAGITIRLSDLTNVNINMELMGALKSMLSKYAYNEVPVNKLPSWSKVSSISITQSMISK